MRELLAGKNTTCIIAAGGGLIDNGAALECLKINDITVIYLEVSADTAWRRIETAPGGLPPFLDTASPRETHRALHERRAAACRATAQIIIDSETLTPEETAAAIIQRLNTA